MKNRIELRTQFVKKTESEKTADGKFSTIVTFLVDDREVSYAVITDGAWLNEPDKKRPLLLKGDISINPLNNRLEITSPSWRYEV